MVNLCASRIAAPVVGFVSRTRLALVGCFGLVLTSPVAGQAAGTTRDIQVLNFATMQSGSMPASTGSLELVDKAGSRVLRAFGASSFRVNLPEVLPENFTLEFDLLPKECCSAEDLAFQGTLVADNTFARVSWGRVTQVVNGGGSQFTATVPPALQAALPGQLTHIMVTFEGGLLKLYTNGERIYTVSDRRFARGNVLMVFLNGDDEDKGAVYLRRLRVAEGIGTPGVTAVVATSAGTGMLSSPGTVSSSQALTAATAVTGLTVTMDAQAKATLKWVAVPDATAYAAMRWNTNDLTCCKNLSPLISTTQWDDGVLADGTYGYRVYATAGSATVVGETRVTVKNGTITETIASAGSGNVASPAPTPPAPPPAPTLDPARSITRTTFNSSLPPPPPPPPPGTLDPARSITRTDFSASPVLNPITGTPAEATLTWSWPDVAVSTEVWRKVGTGTPERRTPDYFQQKTFTDKIEDPRVTYDYQVRAIQSDGKVGVSAWISFTPPPLTNPSSFSGKLSGDKEATLTWQPVPGVTNYRVDGPSLPVTGQFVTGSVLQVKGLQSGAHTWQIASVYGDNLMDMSKRPSATVTIPSFWRSVPYLSMRNGTVNQVEQISYYDGLIQSGTIEDCRALSTWKGYPWTCLDPIWQYTDRDHFKFPGPYEATFADVLSMGAGRHVLCKGAGPEVLCWASTHGPDPGASGWGDATTDLNAALGGVPNRGWTLIRVGYQGTLFAAFNGGTAAYASAYFEPDAYGTSKTATVFDLEGPKNLPHSCLACHGGRYDAIAHKVIGASLIPLDPGVLVFSASGSLTPDQEESVRQINQLVLYSNPSQAVKDYVRGLYGGTPEVGGTKANPNYTPPGWTQAPDLYRKVVKPYCQGCHLQQQNLHFATYQNFVDSKAAIITAVCTTRTMPHSEAALLAFWRNGGSESLPDYLTSALGAGKCSP